MPTPADRLQKQLKKYIEQLMKSPEWIRIGFALLIMAGVYALLMAAMPNFCLNNLITPLVLVYFLWKLGFKGIKKLLLVGLLACLVSSGIWAVVSTNFYLNMPTTYATSDNDELTDGIVTPVYGNPDATYNYTVTVHLANASDVVTNVTVVTGELRLPGGQGHNYTMHLLSNTSTTQTYYYETTAFGPVNLYIFAANISGKWYIATDSRPDSRTPYATYGIMTGPVQKDWNTVFLIMIPFGLYTAFINVFPVYAILVLMVWWLRRARAMRIEAYDKAVSEREKQKAEVEKTDTKVPSLSKAMGLETGDNFVCSECGADVPSEAKVCPKCGEKFD